MCIQIIISILAAEWWIGLWTSLNTIAFIITLFYVIKYTKATDDMAKASELMAKAQREQIKLQERPVISIGCYPENQYHFRTKIRNFSMAHAKVRVLAKIEIHGKQLELTPNHHYNGERIWKLQAGGSDAPTFYGHLDFEKLFIHNKTIGQSPVNSNARVTLDMWVINSMKTDDELYYDKNKNPTVQWYWNNKKWVPEVCPE